MQPCRHKRCARGGEDAEGVGDGEADHSHAAESDCLTSEGLHQSVVDNGGAL